MRLLFLFAVVFGLLDHVDGMFNGLRHGLRHLCKDQAKQLALVGVGGVAGYVGTKYYIDGQMPWSKDIVYSDHDEQRLVGGPRHRLAEETSTQTPPSVVRKW